MFVQLDGGPPLALGRRADFSAQLDGPFSAVHLGTTF
jgi:hypothetical protein